MRLTRFTDNALRCLIYLGLHDDTPAPVIEIATQMGMSPDHLEKVVQRLNQLGYVRAVRGRRGGVLLAKAPSAINVGRLVRATEDNLCLVECFDPERNTCPIAPACVLSKALDDALRAFLASLDALTLHDLLAPEKRLKRLVFPAVA